MKMKFSTFVIVALIIWVAVSYGTAIGLDFPEFVQFLKDSFSAVADLV